MLGAPEKIASQIAVPAAPIAPADRRAVPLLHGLEGLRLIASIGVASIHMLAHAGIRTPEDFTLFVDLFFVISGIVIGNLYMDRIHSWGDYGTFMRRRLARIYPLHLATLLFYVALGVFLTMCGIRMARFDTSQILPNLLLVQAWFANGVRSYNIVSWSISAEFFLYLVFPIIAVLMCDIWGLAVIFVMLLFGIAFSDLEFHKPLYLLTYTAAPIRALPSFGLGVFLVRFGPALAGRLSPKLVRNACLVLLAATLLCMAEDVNGYEVLALIYALVAAAYVGDLKWLLTVMAWRPISRFGYLTYSIYMLHVPVTTVFLAFLFPKLLGVSEPALIFSAIIGALIVAVLAQLSFRYFEDPVRKLLR